MKGNYFKIDARTIGKLRAVCIDYNMAFPPPCMGASLGPVKLLRGEGNYFKIDARTIGKLHINGCIIYNNATFISINSIERSFGIFKMTSKMKWRSFWKKKTTTVLSWELTEGSLRAGI